MRFGILGPVLARCADGTPAVLGGPRARALLALLAAEAGRVVPTDRLIDGMYADAPPEGAANALQSQVSRLRRRLGDAGLVELHPAGYRLAVDPAEVDAHRFTELAGTGRAALAGGEYRRAAELLGDALGLWRGQALADLADSPSVRAQVAALAETRLVAVEDLAEAELELGRGAEVVSRLRGLVAEHPLRERTRGLLVRALAAAGRPAEALAAFEDARRTLAEELGADPSPELAAIHLAVLRDEPAPHRGLPAQWTSFVGRDTELIRLAALLSRERLVTLTGPGGTGKTRLAIEAAARVDGPVCFVELAQIVAEADLPKAVLAALGVREAAFSPQRASGTPVERLVAVLRERPVLLVLDNCEHLIDPVAHLAATLLTGAPGLRILATSREPLDLPGETRHPVPVLTTAGTPVFAARQCRPSGAGQFGEPVRVHLRRIDR
ncbi:BTAD domain-containing putative transcriptional regulator [Amycolatopsis nigrescens]|uniref:BTAD domain-containing putative transcriptional regulator n=1 Tax=Amycolatopsis nigrescens TaxID=381445 RepID=UPI0003A3EB49